MKIVTFQMLDTDPAPAGEPVPDLPPQEIPPEQVPQAEGIPIPTGYVLKGPGPSDRSSSIGAAFD